ncbi:DNA translocase FtsK [Candidatus Giovannonibacteria bacterium]|nr:DNA translocase FtsK [Candidatus Giovannonibacteria bacterium]
MKKKNNNGKNKSKWHDGIKQETKQSVFAVFSFALGILLTLAAFGKAGFVGSELQYFLELLFGKAFFLVPLVFFIGGFSFLFSLRKHFVAVTLIGAMLFLFASLGIVNVIFENLAAGYIGLWSSYAFLKLFDFWAALILLFAMWIAGIFVMLNFHIPVFSRQEKEEGEEEPDERPQAAIQTGPPQIVKELLKPVSREPPVIQPAHQDGGDEFASSLYKSQKGRGGKREISASLPPLDLLEDDRGTPSSGDIKANANIIKRSLQNFGIEVEMMEVNVGPSVTQYTLKPAEGVKLSKITSLQNDLALALAAHPLRIEAPIPGRSLVGIEIPNKSIALVGLRSLFSSDEFQKSNRPLLFTLGRDVSGKPIYADLAKMPHLLIAGATGSGKSVQIHSFMMSLLYRNTPEFLRFILVDPKRVELSIYSKIPHLLTPAIMEAKKTILSLRWAVKEMERRYEVLSQNGVRDISSYHSNILPKDADAETMPYLVIVVDELADIMATYPRELEASIVRLAQMSRAVGIHLVLSTQRPSVEVITGLIKANITSRIAFQVASQIDSRTILDSSGADKLLGNGDMLFLAGDVGKPKRIQGAFVSEKEVKKVVGWIENNSVENANSETSAAIFDNEISSSAQNSFANGSLDDGDDDELYEEARRLAIEGGKISASFLQRRLKVGYARAARLLDMMEERGVIGPSDGAKPREVLNIVNTEEEPKKDFIDTF